MTEGPRELPGKPRSHADHAAQWKDAIAPAGSQQAPGQRCFRSLRDISKKVHFEIITE